MASTGPIVIPIAGQQTPAGTNVTVAGWGNLEVTHVLDFITPMKLMFGLYRSIILKSLRIPIDLMLYRRLVYQLYQTRNAVGLTGQLICSIPLFALVSPKVSKNIVYLCVK